MALNDDDGNVSRVISFRAEVNSNRRTVVFFIEIVEINH